MLTNSTAVPILRYREADKAIDWLCSAFDFAVFLKVPGEDGSIEHARLTLETNMIMLASINRAGSFEAGFKLPADVGGVTQSVALKVIDSDRIYKTAKSAGAKIVTDIEDSPFGGRMFACTDIESHLWVFTTGDLWSKAW